MSARCNDCVHPRDWHTAGGCVAAGCACRFFANDLSAAARALGARGGKAGIGKSQRRGDSAYYRNLVSKRKDRKR